MSRIRHRPAFFRIGSILLGAVLTAGCAAAPRVPATAEAAPDNVSLAAAAERAQDAIRDWDLNALNEAARQLQAAAPENETEAFLRDYWRGTALFHAVLILRPSSSSSNENDQLTSAIQEAAEALESALKRQPGDGESNAMLATLFGMMIAERPWSAVWLGPRLLNLRSAAKSAGGDNPRVRYLEGAGMLNRAAGPRDVQAALESLLEAERLFEAEASIPKSPWDPAWGRTGNQLFIGEAYEKLGKPGEAVIWYQRVLRSMPGSARAREGYERCIQQMENA